MVSVMQPFSKFILHFTCPHCGTDFWIDGYWKWVWKYPFHWFGKRLMKCPSCDCKNWMTWRDIHK